MATRRRRAKSPEGETKGLTIQFRVTPEEKAELETGAKADDLKVGTWLRRLGLKRARELAAGS